MIKKIVSMIKSVMAGTILCGAIANGVYAASGSVCGNYYSGRDYQAVLKHTYSNTRYCELFIRKGGTYSTSTTIGVASGVLSPNTEMNLQRYIDSGHAYATGLVYYGQSPYATLVWSGHVEDNGCTDDD